MAAPDLFQDSVPASCDALTPAGCVHAANPSPLPALRLKPEPQLPAPPAVAGEQTSLSAGECRSALILCAGISLLCPPHSCCCALLRGCEAPALRHPQSPPAKGLPSVWTLFLLHSSLPQVQDPSLSFCLCLFFSFALTRYMGGFLPFGRSEVFCQHSVDIL